MCVCFFFVILSALTFQNQAVDTDLLHYAEASINLGTFVVSWHDSVLISKEKSFVVSSVCYTHYYFICLDYKSGGTVDLYNRVVTKQSHL